MKPILCILGFHQFVEDAHNKRYCLGGCKEIQSWDGHRWRSIYPKNIMIGNCIQIALGIFVFSLIFFTTNAWQKHPFIFGFCFLAWSLIILTRLILGED
jgi:hypothetical protein